MRHATRNVSCSTSSAATTSRSDDSRKARTESMCSRIRISNRSRGSTAGALSRPGTAGTARSPEPAPEPSPEPWPRGRRNGGTVPAGEARCADPMRTAAYVYTGWHPVPERDAAFHPGFTEWELLRACRPRFPGHAQPKVPALGEYDDRDPAALGARIGLAHSHGVDAFVFGVFWCRGKRVFEDGLDRGFLGGPLGATVPFACMWSNRMPRRVLPVTRADLPVLAPERLVASDVDDFVAFVAMLAERYFVRSNHVTVEGRSYLSIYDSTFFVNELGVAGARDAIAAARAWLREHGHRDIHLAAIEPNAAVLPLVREVGFDSVTHYVLLPDWKGPFVQDYREQAELRARQWRAFGERSG